MSSIVVIDTMRPHLPQATVSGGADVSILLGLFLALLRAGPAR
jgi:hypothetical protein